MPDLSGLVPAFQFFVACTGAYLVALWLSAIIWAFRDIQSRTRDVLSMALSTLLVAVFTLPGVVIYLILRPRETLAETYERSLEEEYLLQDVEDAEICPACKRRVDREFTYCPHCRTRLRHDCENCGSPMSLRWAACPHCGH